MRNVQSALKIFLQHYFDVDWMLQQQMETLVQNIIDGEDEYENKSESTQRSFDFDHDEEIRNSYKDLNMLNLIHISLCYTIDARLLQGVVNGDDTDQLKLYFSRLFATHYADKANAAYQRGNKHLGECWQTVAKEIRVPYIGKSKIPFEIKPNAILCYIQAELEEAKLATPFREKEVRLWTNKLEQWNKSIRRDRLERNIEQHIAAVWHDLVLVSTVFRRDHWIRYCHRMSEQAILRGDVIDYSDWEAGKMYVWGLNNESKEQPWEQERNSILFLLVAKLRRTRYPFATNKAWNDLVDHLHRWIIQQEDMDPKNAAIPIMLERLQYFDKKVAAFQRLLNFTRGKAAVLLQTYLSMEYNYFADLQNLAEKAFQLLCQYLSGLRIEVILLYKASNLTTYKRSCKNFECFRAEIMDLVETTGTLMSTCDRFLKDLSMIDNSLKKDLKTGIESVVKHHFNSLDIQLTEYSLQMLDRDIEISFKIHDSKRMLLRVYDTIKYACDSVDWAISLERPDLVAVIRHSGVLLIQSLILHSKLKDDHPLTNVFYLFRSTSLLASNLSNDACKRKMILTQLWSELQYLPSFRSEYSLSIDFHHRPLSFQEYNWYEAHKAFEEVYYSRSNLFELLDSYLRSVTAAREGHLLLSKLYWQLAQKKERRKPGEILSTDESWLLKAIDAYNSNQVTLVAVYQTLNDLQEELNRCGGRDFIRKQKLKQLIDIFGSLLSEEKQVEWMNLARAFLQSPGEYAMVDNYFNKK